MTAVVDGLRALVGWLRGALGAIAELQTQLASVDDPELREELREAWHQLLRDSGAITTVDQIPDLGGVLDQLDAALADRADAATRIACLARAADGVHQFAAALAVERAPGVTVEQLCARLFEQLLVGRLRATAPGTTAILEALQVITEDEGRDHIALDNLGHLLGSPGRYLSELLGPDALADLDGARRVSRRVLYPLRRLPLGGATIHYGPDGPDQPPALVIALGDFTAGAAAASFGVSVAPVAATAGGPGFAMALEGRGALTVPVSERFSLVLGVEATPAVAALLRYDGHAVFTAPIPGLQATLRSHAPAPIVLGDPDGVRLELGDLAARIALTADDVGFGVELGASRIVVRAQDGFLKALLPDGLDVPFELAMDWSWKGGVRFRGAAGLEIHVPMHIALGPLVIDGLDVGLHVKVEDGRPVFWLSLRTAVGARIGPISASVSGLGLGFGLGPGAGGVPPNLGFAHLTPPSFQWPTGVALRLAVGPITGAGALDIDVDAGRYRGALQISIFGIGVTAVAIVDTKVPGVEYSMLFLIDAQFPSIQLGFGFTLLGVGGLVGINRRIDDDQARAGLASGALDAVLQPSDALANLTGFLSNLSALFPPAAERHVFGPKVTIGWGTPTLVTATIGLLIEVPDPIKIVLLGSIEVVLPRRDAAVIELHLDVLGVIDLGRKLLSIDASLHDSRIGPLTVQGDMALRLSWSSQPYFLLSIGGFHPGFAPPPGLPTLRRVSVALRAGVASLSLEAYFALTPNTVQLGARAALAVDLKALQIEGWLGFDALITFQPFAFQVDFSAGLVVRAGPLVIAGIQLAGQLAGPTPWRLRGEAKLSILFVEAAVRVEVTLGERPPDEPALEAVDPVALLFAELAKPATWTLEDAGERLGYVKLCERAAEQRVISPMATIGFRQRAVPLRRVTRIGQAPVAGSGELAIQAARIGGRELTAEIHKRLLQEPFASSQFDELSDAEKLSRPSFEPMPAGLRFGEDATVVTGVVEAALGYEATVIRAAGEAVPVTGLAPPLGPPPWAVPARPGVPSILARRR